MPNFWSNQIQKVIIHLLTIQFDEKENGPRTLDKDFLKKLNEMNSVEIALQKLKIICRNFMSNYERIMEYNRDLTECLFLLYKDTESYKEFSNSLTSIHIHNNNIFTSILKDIDEINQKTMLMPFYFSKTYPLIEKREKKRKIYDHYEKKLRDMEKIYDSRLVKECLNQHKHFIESLERNKIKFKNAKESYMYCTKEAYSTIEGLLEHRFDVINPIMIRLHSVEMKIYESFHKNFAILGKLEKDLARINISKLHRTNLESMYDPLKFMKHPDLDKKKYDVDRSYTDVYRINSVYPNQANGQECFSVSCDNMHRNHSREAEQFQKIENVYSTGNTRINQI